MCAYLDADERNADPAYVAASRKELKRLLCLANRLAFVQAKREDMTVALSNLANRGLLDTAGDGDGAARKL